MSESMTKAMIKSTDRAWPAALLLIAVGALAQEAPDEPGPAGSNLPAPEPAALPAVAPQNAAQETAVSGMPAPESAALPEEAVAAAGALASAQDEAATESGVAAGEVPEDGSVVDQGQPVVAASGGTRTMSGMSILGNEEAPKSLVIVPWKSSEIGDGIGVSRSMNDRAIPVDREVFMREVRYYELRSGG